MAVRVPVDKAAQERAKKLKYSSGNEGRLHPHLYHPGYFQGSTASPRVRRVQGEGPER